MFGWQLEGKKNEQTVLVVWNIAKKFKRKFRRYKGPIIVFVVIDWRSRLCFRLFETNIVHIGSDGRGTTEMKTLTGDSVNA